MSNKHLICIGFAKSGTTLLNHLLSKSEEFIVPAEIKELRYFLPYKFTNNISDYLSYYSVKPGVDSNEAIFFEATPAYAHASLDKFEKSITNIKTLIPNPKILVCLRHPTYRSFSHYIHNINKHFSYRGYSYNDRPGLFKSLYKNSFFEAINNEKDITTKYYDKIKYLESVFGKDNIFYFVIEKDLKNFDNFYQRLCDFVDVKYKSYFLDQDIPRVGSGKLIAQYLYADEQDLIIQSKDDFYQLDRQSLLICNDYGNMIFKDINKTVAYSVSNSQNFWTRRMTADLAKKLTDLYFAEDIKQVSNLIKSNCDISFYNDYNHKDVNIALSRPNHKFLQNKLQRIF